MSYILDALKKATSEREHLQGRVPDLNARPVRAEPVAAQSAIAGVPPGFRIAGIAVAIITVAAAGWLALGKRDVGSATNADETALRKSIEVASQTTARTASPALAMPVPTPSEARIAAVSTPVPVMPPPLNIPEASPKITSEPSADSINGKRKAPVDITPESRTQPPVARGLLSALPAGAPKLAVSGSTYSDNPAWRMVIVNGQVFREGESPAAGMKIDRIGTKSATVSYEGAQYTLRY